MRSSAFLFGFIDGLEKTAISEEVLRSMPKRVGAKVYPTPRLPEARHREMMRANKKGDFPKHLRKMLKKRQPGKSLVRRSGGAHYDPEDRKIEMIRNPATEIAKKDAGNLRVVRSVKGITAAHEASERKHVEKARKSGKPVNDLMGFKEGVPRRLAHHAHPNVLVEEHNLLSSLKGRAPKKAGEHIKALRKSRGETDALKDLFKDKFKDPRAAQFLKPGRKVSRAMKKRLAKIVG